MNHLYILLFIILCAYIFGLVMVAVFERKVTPMLEEKMASMVGEHFTSPKDPGLGDPSAPVLESAPVSVPDPSIPTPNQNKKLDRDLFYQKPTPEEAHSLQDLSGYNPAELESTNKSASWSFSQEKTDVTKTVCFEDHDHTTGKCTYGPTRYPDPRTAAPIEKRAFTLNYPSNMTLQDYTNWLYCFMGRESQLPYNHLKNLEKLKRKIPLVPQEGVLPPPGYYYPSMNVQNYFEQLYNTSSPSQPLATPPPLNSTTSSMLPANADQYSEFQQNFDVYGLSGKITNPDIYLKKPAKIVDKITQPIDAGQMEMTNLFVPYFKKEVEV